MDANSIVHSNEHYDVYCVTFDPPLERDGFQYHAGYELVNRSTGITEAKGTGLPDAVLAAEQCNQFFVKEHWKWISKQEEQTQFEVNPDGSPKGAA